MKGTRLRQVVLGSLVATTLLASFGCASRTASGFPALVDAASLDEPVPTSTVLLALKAQFAKANQAIVELQRAKNVESASRAFAMKKGTGEFSGSVQIVKAGGASVSAIIPFTGYVGSKLKPKISGSGSSLNLHATVLTFEFDPSMPDASSAQASALHRVEIGTFLTDAIVAAFQDAVVLSANPHAPRIALSKLDISATFTVVRKFEGTLGETTIVLTTPDVENLGPSVNGNRERTGTYKIKLTIPFDVDTIPDNRRIIVQHATGDGSTLSVEEPYTEERYRALLREKQSPASAAPGAALGPVLKPATL